MEEVKVVRTNLGEAKWVGAAAAVAVVVGLTVGGAVALKAVGGGGAQPEDVLPANAIAFVKLDLNPSGGQKVAAYQLASKFPALKKQWASEDTSIKEALFGPMFTAKSGFGLDYKKDVAPWLGDRVGVGVFPDMDADKEPEVAVAIAVTDEKSAKVALDKAIASISKTGLSAPAQVTAGMSAAGLPTLPVKATTTGYAFADGYVILSESTATATKLAQAGKANTLADSKYGEDVEKLESDQIGVVWADIAAVYKAIPTDQLSNMISPMTESLKGIGDPKNASGRVVVGLHADPSFVEVTAKAIDLNGVAPLVKSDAGTALIASFPAEVFGAVSLTGLGKQAAALYTSFTAKGDSMGLEVKRQLEEAGLSSAKEIETLLGAETGLMVSGDLSKGQPDFALRTRSNEADAALAIARRVQGLYQPGAMAKIEKVTGPDGIFIGIGSALTTAATGKSGSKLGGTEAFKQVVPDVNEADFAAFVDLAKVIPMFAAFDPQSAASLKPVKALGMTVTGGAEPTLRFRLSFN